MQVTERLPQASNPQVRAKLGGLLHAAVSGLALNRTVTAEDLLVFVYGVLEDGLEAEEAAQRAARAAAEAAGHGQGHGRCFFPVVPPISR
jgi:hypothetical protein